MKEENNIKKKNSINIFYLRSKLNDYHLPESFQDFKNDIESIFNLSQSSIDKIKYIYYTNEKIEKVLDMKTEEGYKNQKSKILKMIRDEDLNIYIKFDSIDIDYEENIKCLVENEIKDAAERIINGLKLKENTKINLKIRDKKCDNCKKRIIGVMYKNVIDDEINKDKNESEKYYCEICSLDIQEPLFIIH